MKKEVIIFLVLTLFINLASASFTVGNKSEGIETSYSQNDILRGWINISLSNEPADSYLSSNFPGKIKIRDFLENQGKDYSCIPADCEADYTLSNGKSTKTFAITGGQEKIAAFVINGIINSIDSISFDVSADNEPSCTNPLEIDILNNGVEWKSKKFIDDFTCTYQGGRGCFNPSESLKETGILTTPYCEKIMLGKGNRYLLGAWVRNGTTTFSPGLLKMTVYDGTRQASCDLPAPLNQGGEISCSLNFDIYTTDYYYVCLRATQNTNYNTTTEDVNPCGFYGVPPGPDVKHDYNIFARAAKYDKIEKFSYNQQEYARQGNTGELKNEVLGYLDARYGKNCAKNCTIPVKFKAYGNFNIVVSNLSLTYSTIGNPPYTERMIYDATEQQAKISSGFKNLDLSYSDINLSGSGNKTLDLFLGDIKILSKVINFAKIPIIYSILPSTVSAGVPVKLVAFVSPPANRSITEYKWDFDGNVQVTSANSIVHTFNSVGANSVKLSVKDSTGAEASKEFTIIAGNPKQLANETLKKYRGRINNITREIETYPGWYKEYIEREIDIENLEFELASLERKFTVASSDEDFSGIMLNLSSMNIPRSIARGNDNSFFLLFDAEDINLERLDELDAGSCENGSEENYKEAILKWYNLNKASIEYFTISAYYDNEIRKVVTYFKIKKDGENYFIVNKNQGDVIINSDKAEDFDDSAGVVFENETEFIVLGEINPVEIIAYLSPEFRQLEISDSSECNYNGKCEEGENSSNCRNDCKPIGRIILYIIILIVAAVVIYIIMEEWYRRKYENYLFKNRNDLFNLVNFIVNAQHKGISNSEIEKRLGSLGWNLEQIHYAFKKVRGKRTGMLGEGLFGFLNKKKQINQ